MPHLDVWRICHSYDWSPPPCPLSGTIPTQIGGLARAGLVRLDKNMLTGPIPTEVGKLAAVTEFRLDENFLKGTLPTELGYLANIVQLRLGELRWMSKICLLEHTGTSPHFFVLLLIHCLPPPVYSRRWRLQR